MNDLIFDSLTHPTPAGTWMGKDCGNTFAALDWELETHGFEGACAVGMFGLDGWDPVAFAEACRSYPRLVPVAGYKPTDPTCIREELAALCDLGYRGIKLHNRFSGFAVDAAWLGPCFAEAARLGLVVFWCTFHHGRIESWPRRDPLAALVEVLRAAPTARVVLLHGGDVDLLRYMQLVRFNHNLLLDLSHTIAKYPGSSLDLDIRFLFRHLDRRLCLGTDWPQFSHGELRDLFERHAEGLDPDKRASIARRNLRNFLGLEEE